MVIKINNLDKVIKRVTDLSRIDDNPVGRVYTNVDYAVHQEYGFVVKSKDGGTYVPPQPFMLPALEDNKKLISQMITAYLQKELRHDKPIKLKPAIATATGIVQKRAIHLVPVSVRRGVQAPKGLRTRPSKKGEAVGGHLRDSIKMEVK